MTIEEMKKKTKEHMNTVISCLGANLITARQARSTLCSYLYAGLVSDDEYRGYCDLIRQTENKRIFREEIERK